MAGKAIVLSLEKLGLIVPADAGTDKEVSRVKTAILSCMNDGQETDYHLGEQLGTTSVSKYTKISKWESRNTVG